MLPSGSYPRFATNWSGLVLVHVRESPTGPAFVAVIDPLDNEIIAKVSVFSDLDAGGIADLPR